MSSKHQVARIMAALAVLMILAGCNAPFRATAVEPTVNMQPTYDAIATQSAQTVVADLTKNAPTAAPATATELPTTPPLPTSTDTPPAPTFTPIPPTNTPTQVFWTATPRPTVAYNCTVNLTQPPSGTNYDKNAPFDGKWTVTNTGTNTWFAGDVDFKYISGTKFQDSVDALDLTGDVPKGSSVTMIIDMTAPASTGSYSATWGFVKGSDILCPVYVSIYVR